MNRSSLNILFIDDKEEHQELFSGDHKDVKIQVEYTNNILLAPDVIKDKQIQCIVLDEDFIRNQSFQNLVNIKKYSLNIPIVLMISQEYLKHMDQGTLFMFSDFITKPFSEHEFSYCILKNIKNKKSKRYLETLYVDLMEDLQTASKLQEGLFPHFLSKKGDFMLSSTYHPSYAVGGDLFGFIQLNENEYMLYIGDVSGHGVQAALLVHAVNHMINTLVDTVQEPHLIVKKIEEKIFPEFSSHYVTLFVAKLDKTSMKYYNAGHPPPYIYDENSIEALDQKGSVPVGWGLAQKRQEKDQYSVNFENKKVFLYTDGIFECFDSHGEAFDVKKIKKVIFNKTRVGNDYMLPHMMYDLIRNESCKDDVTFVNLGHINQKEFLFCTHLSKKGISEVCKSITDILEKEKVKEEVTNKIDIIVCEYISNIINNNEDENRDIQIFLTVGEKVIVKFYDEGVYWDYADVLEAKKKDTELYKENGRGLIIIEGLSNKVIQNRFEHINEFIVEVES
jgi:sigma-B regulation protein RsbU (phosphoserine phosphatase)